MRELTRLSACELAHRVRDKSLSPVEIVAAHLDAIERLNPKVNAIVTLVADRARVAARAA